MYHLLSVSSAMLISFLIGLLFAAMCAIVGRQKGYSTALCILLGFFGRLICTWMWMPHESFTFAPDERSFLMIS